MSAFDHLQNVFKWNFQYFCLCSWPLVFSPGITKKNLTLSSLHLPIRYFLYSFIDQVPPSLLFYRLNSSSSLSLFSHSRCSNPSIIYVAHCRTHSSISLLFSLTSARTPISFTAMMFSS